MTICWFNTKFFQINILGIVWQTEKRITSEILEVEGLKSAYYTCWSTFRASYFSEILSFATV